MWIYSFASNWQPQDLPVMMMKGFEAAYEDSTLHGPFILNKNSKLGKEIWVLS